MTQKQVLTSQQGKELMDSWDQTDRSDLGINQLNDIAEALANAQRYDDAIAACDLSLVKLSVNLEAKIIKAYSL
ncbi:MAG: hypothetical protein ACKPKO_47345, partial [Candidatus Fonsibacter sp.]